MTWHNRVGIAFPICYLPLESKLAVCSRQYGTVRYSTVRHRTVRYNMYSAYSMYSMYRSHIRYGMFSASKHALYSIHNMSSMCRMLGCTVCEVCTVCTHVCIYVCTYVALVPSTSYLVCIQMHLYASSITHQNVSIQYTFSLDMFKTKTKP